MTPPGDETPGPAGGAESAAKGPARKGRRVALVALVALGAVAVASIAIALVAVLVGQDQAEADPLGPDAPALSEFTMHPGGTCTYEPDSGGLVAHFDVSSRDAGRFTLDVEAVTEEGLDNQDIPTTHVVRFSVPFYGGPTRQEFDVVVPLTEADYQRGYRECRFVVNPPEG